MQKLKYFIGGFLGAVVMLACFQFITIDHEFIKDPLYPPTVYASYMNKYSGNNVCTVAKDGNADSQEVQDCLDDFPVLTDTKRGVVIVGPGLYTECVNMPQWATIRGAGVFADATIRCGSGATVTLSGSDNAIAFIRLESQPTADGGYVLSAPSGGRHDIFTVDIGYSTSTDGITGGLLTASSTSEVVFSEVVNDYTNTGSAVGVKTHDIINMQGSSSLLFVRSELTSTVSDVDDEVNNILDNTDGDIIIGNGQLTGIHTNASYSGEFNLLKHTKNGGLHVYASNLLQLFGSGAGDGNAIFVDTDTDNGVLNTSFNVITVVGFTTNHHVDVAEGDVVNSAYDFIAAASDLTAGDGLVNYIGTTANGALGLQPNGTTAIDVADEWHAITQFEAALGVASDNVIVTDGIDASIFAVADAGGGDITVTSFLHGLSVGDYITITGTVYDGVYEILTTPSTNTFTVTATYSATDTGFWDRGSSIRVTQRGFYTLQWNLSADVASANQELDFTAFNGTTELLITGARRLFATANDVGSMSGGGQFFLEKDEIVWFAIKNNTSAADADLYKGSFYTSKES